MYTKHFGFNTLPFENVPDPKFFFDEGDHARIHSHVKDSLLAGRGLTVVTGPIGSGKTTLSQMIVSDFSSTIKLIWIAEPPESSSGLFMFIAEELGITPESKERVFVIRDIKDALMKINNEGSKCLLIIDESHLMTDDVFNGIRLLNNLEIGSSKLIQILLLGQQEIMELINRPEMEPFKQRIATLEVMGKMNKERIQKYITHRIEIAGGSLSIFENTGWEALSHAFGSENIPRLINSLCDRSLTVAFENKKVTVDVDDVYKAAEGLGLQKEVFFYKIQLNKERKESHAPSNGGATITESPAEKTEQPSANKAIPAAPIKQQSETTAVPARQFGVELPSEDDDNLKKPIIYFILSIAALVISTLFYCSKSASPDLISCIFELIGL